MVQDRHDHNLTESNDDGLKHWSECIVDLDVEPDYVEDISAPASTSRQANSLVGAPAAEPLAIEAPTAKRFSLRQAAIGIVVAALVVAGGSKLFSAIAFGQTHVSTDDAYVTGDLVSISPVVSGTLAELTVQDGDFVHKGQLIARLNDDSSEAELEQARANELAAESQVPQAEAALRFAELSTSASIRSSEAAITTQSAKTAGSRMQVRLSSDTVRNQVAQATEQLAQTKDMAAQARAGVEAARAGLASARQAVETAQRNAEAVRSGVDAADAENRRAQQDLQRYKSLLAEEAVSRQQYDTVAATAASAAANLDGAHGRTAAAESQIAQAKSAMQQAQAQFDSAEAQASAAGKQVQVTASSLELARANQTQVGIQSANVQTNESEGSRATADLATAQAGSEEVALRAKQIATARAQVLQTEAAVRRARVQVTDASLFAPCDGFVVKHAANVGTAINPGQSIVTITRGSQVWVMANFKETQLTNVHAGQPAEIEVDAFPGKVFRGEVASVLHATGAATTLLPPDNSTGNFTKVVQRVPVKITFASADADRLREGMSVQATIETASRGRQ